MMLRACVRGSGAPSIPPVLSLMLSNVLSKVLSDVWSPFVSCLGFPTCQLLDDLLPSSRGDWGVSQTFLEGFHLPPSAETFKEDLGELLLPGCPCCWVLKKGVNPALPTFQVSADPWDFTGGEQVDADVFYDPMQPAWRRAARLMSPGIKGERSFMFYWGAPGRQEGMESPQGGISWHITNERFHTRLL